MVTGNSGELLERQASTLAVLLIVVEPFVIGHCSRSGRGLTIGCPTPDNSVYILDSNLRPVPQGQVGVMWSGGCGVSQGYLNRPELTGERFKQDPFRSGCGVMYNTEDLGRMRIDREIEHFGRIDDQVKVKGFRVELDGVSASMQSCPGVVSACALLIDGELWGFYSPLDVPRSRVEDATTHIQPCYAVPSTFVALASLPLTR
ncbi:hypothetical protein C8Q74DRAFT_1320276 [Fomes fomentarius]|nr:hypothetical protein C8Q74DRAFT_1320276 [Fomes fomentarius]